MRKLTVATLSIFFTLLVATQFSYSQTTADIAWVKGINYGSHGEFQKANEALSTAQKLDPFHHAAVGLRVINDVVKQKLEQNAAIHFFRAEIHAYSNQEKKAISEYTTAIEIDQQFADAYNNRGKVYLVNGQHVRAGEDFSTAIKLSPDLAGAYNNYGLTKYHAADYEHAVLLFNMAIELSPIASSAFNNRGVAYCQGKQQHKQGISDFDRAIMINPNFAEAYNNRAISNYFSKEYDKAFFDVLRSTRTRAANSS